MEKEKLIPWLEKLNKAEKKDRTAVVAEMCKENGLKIGDAWKLLKEAGFDPKADTGAGPSGSGDPESSDGRKKLPVVLRHKSGYPRYRRAGLVLTQKAETYEVTEAQLAALEKDKWVEFVDSKKDAEKE
jgi:hypothetical protein